MPMKENSSVPISSSDFLRLYPGHYGRGLTPSAEMQLVYSTVPANPAAFNYVHIELKLLVILETL